MKTDLAATPTGLEPATSAVTGRRANQLRYRTLLLLVPRFGDPNGIRTRAAAVKGRCPRPLNDGAKKRDAVKHQEPRLPALVAIVQAERYL